MPATRADDDDTYAFDDDAVRGVAAVADVLKTTTSATPHHSGRDHGRRKAQKFSATAWNACENWHAGAHNEAQHKHKLKLQRQQKSRPDEFKSKEEAKLKRFNQKHPERFHKLIERERKTNPERFEKHRAKWIHLGVLTTSTTTTTTTKPAPLAPPLNGKCGDLMLAWGNQNLGLHAHRGCL